MSGKEGWVACQGSKKWHYMINGRSLCRKFGFLGNEDNLEQGKDNSPDTCTPCKNALFKAREKKEKANGK